MPRVLLLFATLTSPLYAGLNRKEGVVVVMRAINSNIRFRLGGNNSIHNLTPIFCEERPSFARAKPLHHGNGSVTMASDSQTQSEVRHYFKKIRMRTG